MRHGATFSGSNYEIERPAIRTTPPHLNFNAVFADTNLIEIGTKLDQINSGQHAGHPPKSADISMSRLKADPVKAKLMRQGGYCVYTDRGAFHDIGTLNFFSGLRGVKRIAQKPCSVRR